MPQVPSGWDEEMRNFFNSQRSEEGPLQAGLVTTDSSEKNEGLDVIDDAILSYQANGDEDDSEEEETEEEQSPPSSGNINKREVNLSSESILSPSLTHNSFMCMFSVDRVLRSPMTKPASGAPLHLENFFPRARPLV
jgi:hypothetical protein